MRLVKWPTILFVCMLYASMPMAGDYPFNLRAHSQGNLQLTVNPNGGWGQLTGAEGQWIPFPDPYTGDSIYGCVYPRGSRNMFIAGQMCLGAIVARDTLVSMYWDLMGLSSPWRSSTTSPDKSIFSPDARSALDLEIQFHDSTDVYLYWERWERERHHPLGVTVTQRSMAWSGATIDDFVLFDYEIVNRGINDLHDFYVTFLVSDYGYDMNDGHLMGYLDKYKVPDACDNWDILNLAYMMDNDGNPVGGHFTPQSKRGAVGVMLIGASSDSVRVNYNWVTFDAAETEDWGPRKPGSLDDPFRSFNPYFAWPGRNNNLYYLMSQPEQDYDQMFAAVNHYGWLPPWQFGEQIAAGLPGAFFYSFGPFDIPVREKINYTIAVVGGDNVHTNPNAVFYPDNPQAYYDQLDFSELATNAQWAKWVYDNPGVDTDSDGYFGEYRICEGETTWYKGDGVPDFRGNTPPPIPFTRYETEAGKIIVRWNGYLSETTKDIFSNLIDFEGYRVYCGLDNRKTSLALLTSYDKQDWLRWKFNELGSGESRWFNDDPPFSLDSLRNLHNNPDFNPDDYPRQRPLFQGDSAFYFSAVDENVYSLTTPNGIHKAYPDAINPGTDSTLWTEADITIEHDGRRLPKYYEYEYVIDNLLPTVPYFVAVTVFDFGYAGGRGNMPPDETNPLNNVTECYAQTSSEIVEEENLDAYVYPNPYRVDAKYEDGGYENRKGNIIPDRARLIHFGNLPRVCKIKVYSLDGDHIGTIDHNFPEGGPESMHDWWNLVSRSGLAVESGLYYWVVESATRTQIGKLVILK